MSAPRSHPSVFARARDGLGRADPRAVAAGLGLLVAAVLGLGLLHLATEPTDPGLSTGVLDLDGERTLATVLSGLLLFAAAALTLLSRKEGTRAFLALAAFFAFMGLDEGLAFHEKLETAAGVTWEVLYAPVALVGGAAWLRVLRDLPRPAGWLLGGGAAAWVIAVVLEAVQWNAEDEPVGAYDALMVVEEALELTGSTLWILAFLVALRSSAGPRPTQ